MCFYCFVVGGDLLAEDLGVAVVLITLCTSLCELYSFIVYFTQINILFPGDTLKKKLQIENLLFYEPSLSPHIFE